ncbi:MAG: polyphosphate kinase 2 family protein, partial [Lacisediminihabitans sp.]
MTAWKSDPADLLKVGEGFVLADVDTSSIPGIKGNKSAGAKILAANASALASQQERLFAESRFGGERSL